MSNGVVLFILALYIYVWHTFNTSTFKMSKMNEAQPNMISSYFSNSKWGHFEPHGFFGVSELRAFANNVAWHPEAKWEENKNK